MSSKFIHILSDAEIDLEDGKNFYESQKEGVGDYFWDSLISDIESLIIYGGVHSVVFNYYRMSSKRFPYSIYYDVKDEDIFVIAVLPEKINPSWISNKVNKKS